MSYIAFDLDALNACPMVGAACGLSAEQVSHGLLQMWAWCFRAELDTISTTHVRGFFYGSDATEALASFGFLESSDGSWRVRGAARYLRIKTAQREAGKAAASNLRKGRQSRSKAGGTAKVDLRVSSGSTSGSAPALTPTTDDRAPSTESEKPAPASRSPRETDALVEDFKAATGSDYRWQSTKDGAAFAALRKDATLEEIRTRWRRGLRATGWRNVATVAQLAAKWNDLATADPPLSSKAPLPPAVRHGVGEVPDAF